MTNLPQPVAESYQASLPAPGASRLISVYLRTLSSPQTIKTYNTELVLFALYVEGELGKELGTLTAEDVSLYREHLINSYAPATVAKKLAVLRRFLIFTFMAGATTVNPESLRFFAKSPRVRQDSSYNVLTDEELSRMLAAARASNYRDYVMLAVMAGCGLREVELVGIKIGDFRDVGGGQTFLRVLGKGDKVRNVPLSPDLWRLIQRYVLLTERSFTSHLDSRKPLFTSRVGKDKSLTTRSVQNIVKKYVRAANITKAISPHSIRHTVGTNMAVNEAPLLVIQQFLGHSDPKTTLRYIRRAEELATKAYQYNTLPL
ncbi:MAG: tyrosine-type recombinase/integrase [Actinomycetota bacterium]|nr:tyrosine-type recombinase/integrase [Actinomycetota bacterium]